MENKLLNLYQELILTKQEFLDEIENEICMLGDYIELERKSSCSSFSKDNSVPNMQYNLQLLKVYEEHLNDIETEIELISYYMELEEKIRQLTTFIDKHLSNEEKYKKLYEDILNSKLGRLQRFWWRINKKKK